MSVRAKRIRSSPSRDHLLAEVMRRCFQQLAQHLDARKHFDDAHQDLRLLKADELLALYEAVFGVTDLIDKPDTQSPI